MRCPMCHVILSGPRQYFHHRCWKRKAWQDEGEAKKAIKRTPISVGQMVIAKQTSESNSRCIGQATMGAEAESSGEANTGIAVLATRS